MKGILVLADRLACSSGLTVVLLRLQRIRPDHSERRGPISGTWSCFNSKCASAVSPDDPTETSSCPWRFVFAAARSLSARNLPERLSSRPYGLQSSAVHPSAVHRTFEIPVRSAGELRFKGGTGQQDRSNACSYYQKLRWPTPLPL